MTAHIYMNDRSLACLVSSLARCAIRVELKGHMIPLAFSLWPQHVYVGCLIFFKTSIEVIVI